MTDNIELLSLLSQIIDKLNRIEANVTHLRGGSEGLKGTIDVAVNKLNQSIIRHGR